MLSAAVPTVIAGVVVFVLGGLIRWGLKVDKMLDKHEDILDRMLSRLDAHAALDDARFEAVQALIAAQNGARYSKRRKTPSDKNED